MRIREIINELVYPGNIGIMELAKFFRIATDAQKIHFKKLRADGKDNEAWDYMQQIVGVQLK